MSHTTTKWGFIIPDETDTDDVPSWLEQLADGIDVTIAGFKADTYANRPNTPATLIDGLFFWATDTGALYVVQGGALKALQVSFGDTAHTTTAAFGDVASAGNGTDGAAPISHRHGMPANPVTAHVAAGDPHSQYALDTDVAATNATVAALLLNSSPRYTRQLMLMGA